MPFHQLVRVAFIMSDPVNPYQSSDAPPVIVQAATENQGDNTGGMIPYKNPYALIAYYLGIFSLFPVIGLILAIPAFVLGIMGLQARKRNPVIKGSVHAWIGIVMGGLMTLIWGGLLLVLLVLGVTA